MPTFDVSTLGVRPISPNPGGQIDPGDHIGHGDEYLRIKTALNGQGALLTGDRRMGKSSMLTVIETELSNAGHEVVRVSAETEHFETFADRVRSAVRSQTAFGKELDAWTLEVDLEKSGIRLRRDPTGKTSKADQDIDEFWDWAARKARPNKLFVILDEITVLAHEMHKRADGAGLELLRSLKRARDMRDGPVMLFAGSIGLHHALDDFTPVNDLTSIPIGPLDHDDAVYLSRCLTAGANLNVDDASAVAEAMAIQTDGIAFYLHHLANTASLHQGTISPATIADITSAAIEDPDDPWEFRHYDERVDRYFGTDASKVRWLLDTLALAPVAPELDELLQLILGQPFGKDCDRAELVALLDRLERDHYTVRAGSTGKFASELLRRAWTWIRRL